MVRLGKQDILGEEAAFEKTHSIAMERRSHLEGQVMDWGRQVREGGPTQEREHQHSRGGVESGVPLGHPNSHIT